MFNAISHQKNANENHNQYQYNLTGVAKIKINDNTGCLGEEEAGGTCGLCVLLLTNACELIIISIKILMKKITRSLPCCGLTGTFS